MVLFNSYETPNWQYYLYVKEIKKKKRSSIIRELAQGHIVVIGRIII